MKLNEIYLNILVKVGTFKSPLTFNLWKWGILITIRYSEQKTMQTKFDSGKSVEGTAGIRIL